MALPILTTAATISDPMPLIIDPAVVAANPQPPDDTWSLARYQITGDDTGVIVPPDATRVRIFALSRDELDAAIARAGRLRAGDLRTYVAVITRVSEVRREQAPVRAACVEAFARYRAALAEQQPGEPDPEQPKIPYLPEPSEVALGELDDDGFGAYRRHEEWLSRRNRELVRAGCAAWLDPRGAIEAQGPGAFPVERLEGQRWGGDLSVRDVLAEIARLVLAVSSLGKARSQSSASSSGASTSTASAGPAETIATGTQAPGSPAPSESAVSGR